MNKIDINCDLGEGMVTDELIMPYITSCNISCGAHAGNAKTLANTLLAAKKHGIKIGAHPSYPDRVNFGRSVLKISKSTLEESIITQLDIFHKAAERLNLEMHHIKPHGALYNQAAVDPDTAEVILSIMKMHYPKLILFTPFGSVIASMAPDYDIKIWHEAFADRNYADDLTLIPRTQTDALKHDINDILAHVELIAFKHQVKTLSGKNISLRADTICIHGDHPMSETIAKALYTKFTTPQ